MTSDPAAKEVVRQKLAEKYEGNISNHSRK